MHVAATIAALALILAAITASLVRGTAPPRGALLRGQAETYACSFSGNPAFTPVVAGSCRSIISFR